MTFRYTIDPPPSANAIWRNVKGRTLKSKVYRQWLDRNAWKVKTQHVGEPIDGPVTVSIHLNRPRANADIDNRIKPALDVLEAAGAIVNDKQVMSVYAAWVNCDPLECTVTVSPDVGAAA